MHPATGSDVESICSKCGDVWHVVVAMVGDKIAKVQCKECGAYHRYRPPGGKARAAAATPRRRSAGAAVARSLRTSGPSATAIAGPAVEPDLSRPTQPYSASETFQVADRVEHPKFGIGVVEAAQPGKIDVYFPDGRRVLAQARPETRLERPRRLGGFDE